MDQQTVLTIPAKQAPISTSTEPETTPTTTPSTAGASVKLTAAIVLVSLSIWANFEASKLFDVKVLNGAKHTVVGKQFQLMFVSNGHAERLILNSSHFVEHFLFPVNSYTKKPVHKVTLYFSGQNMATDVLVTTPAHNLGEFIITLSPSVMAVPADAEMAVAAALHLGMAHVWLWDGNGKAPRALVNAMAEFLVLSAGLRAPNWEHKDVILKENATCWHDSNPAAVAKFLKYCDERRRGFITRLNSAMQEEFNEGMVDMALGGPAHSLCLSYLSSTKAEEVISLPGGNYKHLPIVGDAKAVVM